MKIGILGNCQAQGFAASVAALCPSCEAIYVNVASFRANTDVEEAAQKLYNVNVLFSQNINYKHQSLTDADLSEKIGKIIKFPAIAFNGFHPDLVYAASEKTDIQGVMGPYHSALALACFLENLSIQQAVDLFNKYTFSSLGYLTAYDLAADMMIEKSKEIGFEVESLFRPDRSGPFMHTINHPTIEALFLLAEQGVEKAGLAHAPANLPADGLSHHPIWPIYPEIAVRFGWKGGYIFSYREKRYDLEEFITASYRVYARQPSIDASAPVDRARSLIRTEIFGSKEAKAVTIDDVQQGFRWILGRNCENVNSAEAHARICKDTGELRRILIRSKEFSIKYETLRG